jgi:hypothetical protein
MSTHIGLNELDIAIVAKTIPECVSIDWSSTTEAIFNQGSSTVDAENA